MPLVNGVEQETAVTDAGITEVAAESSTADESKIPDVGPKSMLEAVQAAIAPEAAETKDEAAEPSTAKTGEKDEGAPKDEGGKEDEPPPFHKHPRWQELQTQKRTLEARVAELEPQVADFEAFRGEVRASGMSSDEVNSLFEIGRLMKTDPAKAFEKMQPYISALQGFTGEVLPEDLAAKVESGVLDKDSAKEIAKLRAQGTHREQSEAAARERTAAEADEQAKRDLENFGNACAAAVTAETKRWGETDPDYPKKAPLVKARLLELLQAKGPKVRTVEDAVALAKEAKSDVEKDLGLIVGKRPAVRTVTGGSSAQTKTQPTTMLDAMKAAVGG